MNDCYDNVLKGETHGCHNCALRKDPQGEEYTEGVYSLDYPCRICRHSYQCHWRPKE